MKVEMIFITAVLSIALIHLIFRLVNILGGLTRRGALASNKKQERSDWYVFFKPSDLYGRSADKTAEYKDVRKDVTPHSAYEEGCQPQESYT